MNSSVRVFELSLPDPSGAADAVHPALIRSAEALILFDAGYPGQADAINLELERVGFSLAELTHIVLSHHDHDHVGSLAAIKRTGCPATVLSSAVEAPYIAGTAESLRVAQAREHNRSLTGREREWGEGFLAYLSTVEPCAVDRTIADFPSRLDRGVAALSTPGHTPGHISLYLEDTGTLLAGDALVLKDASLGIANPRFALDLQACERTAARLSALNPARVLCYHGGSLDTGVDEAFRRLLAELSS